MSKRKAHGGRIPAGTRSSVGGEDVVTVMLSGGVAVIPDHLVAKMGREYLSQLNGGGEVLSVSEALAELDAEGDS